MKTPKYLQIKTDLETEIKSGNFASGDKFYSEKELINKYNVSSITVIRAIQELTNEGFLVRHQGKGTFISRSRKRSLVEFSDIEIFEQSKDVVKVLAIDLCDDDEIRAKLKLKKNQTFYKITRIRSYNEEAYFLQFSYIPSTYLKENIENKSYYESIYHRFKTDFGINANEQLATETNEICFPTPILIADELGIDPKTPTVLQQKITELKDNGDVIEFVESYKKWNYYKIEFSTFSPN